MLELLQMGGFLAGAFVASFTLAFAWGRSRRKTVVLVPLRAGARVRMVGPGGTYQCSYLGQTKERLLFTAPHQRGRPALVQIGESVLVQAPLGDTVISFKSSVIAQSEDLQQMSLELPRRIRQLDRRCERRNSVLDGTIVRVNGQPASIQNFSAGGARILTQSGIYAGDAVQIEFPGRPQVSGWALESSENGSGSRDIRICFEEPFTGLCGIQRRQLYLGN